MNRLTDYTVKELAKKLNRFIAKDMGNQWFAFQKEPIMGNSCWIHGGDYISLAVFDFREENKVDWKDSLVSPPTPPVDWSKVAVDTPVMVRCYKDGIDELRYFAMYLPKSNTILTFYGGKTSKTALDVSHWKYFRLATPEEIERYTKE